MGGITVHQLIVNWLNLEKIRVYQYEGGRGVLIFQKSNIIEKIIITYYCWEHEGYLNSQSYHPKNIKCKNEKE